MKRRIMICGAPRAGKTTIVSGLGNYANAEPMLRSFSTKENLARIDVSLSNVQLALITISGSFNYLESQTAPKLLAGASAIIYVCSAVKESLHSEPSSGHNFDNLKQLFFWDLYVQHAKQVESSWINIPWIFVLNKIDLGTVNPLSGVIPKMFQSEIIPTSATQGQGISDLFQKIANLSW